MALTLLCMPHLRPSQSSQVTLHGSPMTRQVHCLASRQTANPVAGRTSANFQPTIWSYNFVQSLKNHYADELYKDRAEKLEEEVRSMINVEDAELLTILELIDDIQRLGLGHRFEKDIKKALDRFVFSQKCNDRTEKSLHATALSFRLLRQHGYKVSQDVFKSFKDHKGDFKTCVREDVKGMLSLYEASYLAFEGENILDEASTFTSIHLKNLEKNPDKSLAELVSYELELPLHRRMLRQEARWYIEACGKRKDFNNVLLELAKLDFNMMQSVLQTDLQDMARWWKDMGLANKLNFARDRLMECFFWTVGVAFEPQFSSCRKGLTKVFALVTAIDDVYDVYGTLDELVLFTDAVERWDVNAVSNLPDYMKLCFLALYNTINEMAYDSLKEQGVNSIPLLTRAWADLCKAFLQEAKWKHSKYIPPFNDYLENAWQSVSGVVQLIHAYFWVNQSISKQALESLINYHDLLRWPSIIFRLCNDLSTSSAELERGELANSISCYMHETGLSEELARRHISDLIDQTWKKVNKYLVDDSLFPKPFVETAINLARISHCQYQYGDGHGDPDVRAKNRVLSIIVEPISLINNPF